MKAAVLVETGCPLEIWDDVICPDPFGHQVLVKVEFSGVCRSQLMEAEGSRGRDRYLPHLLGHEAVGVVEKTGSLVNKVEVGERVVLSWMKGLGGESQLPLYKRLDGTTVNAGRVTTFNEFAIVSECHVSALPAYVPPKIGVLLGCALTTGGGIVINELPNCTNKKVCIVGLGGVGLSALCTLSALNTAASITCIDSNPEKEELARVLGCDYFFASRGSNKSQEIVPETETFDVVLEAAGSVNTIEFAFSLLKKGGTCVFASHPPSGQRLSLDPFDLIQGKKLRGTWGGGSSCLDSEIDTLSRMLGRQLEKLSCLVDISYPLEDVNLALDSLRDHRAFRPIIEFS